MTLAHRRRRRSRYASRAHDVETRNASPAAVATVVPDEVAWKVRAGEDTAHAYSLTAGWMRSACRRERWTVLLAEAPDDLQHCFECHDLVNGEITELEQHAMDGNR